MSIYSLWNNGFGDLVLISSILAKQALETNNIVRVSKKGDSRFAEVLSLFLEENRIEVVEEDADIVFFSDHGRPDRLRLRKLGYYSSKSFEIIPYWEAFKRPIISTKIKWVGGTKTVAYCFKARSKKDRKEIPEKQQTELLIYLRILGYECLEIGKHLSNEECVRILSKCDFYVGIDTGPTHLAICVGTPTHIITHKLEDDFIEKHYPNRGFKYRSIYDFIDFLRGKEPSLCVGLTISYESLDLIERCFNSVIDSFKGVFESFIVIFQSSPHREYLQNKYNIIGLEIADDVPIFIRHQEMIKCFLNRTNTTHFIKIDPDTIVLQWSLPYPCLAGQFAHYRPEHQKARWNIMPKEWKKVNKGFVQQKFMHGINGGFSLICREYCKKIVPFFFEEKLEWDCDTLRNGFRKEIVDENSIIGEEHSIAWYLHRAQIKAGEHYYVSDNKEFFYTQHGEVDKIPNKSSLCVFHPVKNGYIYKQLTNEESNIYKGFTLGIVFSYESLFLLERCILLALRAYNGYVNSIIVVNKSETDLEYLVKKYGIIELRYKEIEYPYFYYYQDLMLFYLKNCYSSHLVLIDSDTVILQWDHEFHEVAGEKIWFKFQKQQEVFKLIPKEISGHFVSFKGVGCIHAIQGGYSMYSREYVEGMSKVFCNKWVIWPKEAKNIEEQILGYYVRVYRRGKNILEPLGDMPQVKSRHEGKYATDPKYKVKRKRYSYYHVLHPVKTKQHLLEILEALPMGEEILRFLQRRGME